MATVSAPRWPAAQNSCERLSASSVFGLKMYVLSPGAKSQCGVVPSGLWRVSQVTPED